MASKVNNYGATDLDQAQQVALELADALMTQPTHMQADLRTRLEQYFSRDQIIELTLDIMKWNYQKVAVALRVDVEVSPGELVDLRFDDAGHWVR